jgi:excisionase family DNA binding protein
MNRHPHILTSRTVPSDPIARISTVAYSPLRSIEAPSSGQKGRAAINGMSNVQPIRRRSSSGDTTSMSCLPRLVTAAVIAAAIGCTAKHVYDLAKRSQVPHYRIGSSVRFNPQEIAEWLETMKVAA